MAIFLNPTPTPSFPLHQNPKKHHNHKSSPLVSCRATASVAAPATDFYQILSLKPRESDPNEIKKAYRTMALKYHPDVYGQDERCSMSREECTKKFVQVHAAYKTLSDPILREEYEKGLTLMADFGKKRWREQLEELKRRSSHKGNSWASRIRSQNHN